MWGASGHLIKNKMYFLEGVDESANPKLKMAVHGMSGMPKNEKALPYLTELAEYNTTTYKTRAHPEPLKAYALRTLRIATDKDYLDLPINSALASEPGTWIQADRVIRLEGDPNQWIDETGERRWKVFEEQPWMTEQKNKLKQQQRYYSSQWKPTPFQAHEMKYSKQPLERRKL
jgi:hypothetical protein